jgi:transcriptional regulator of arginine metabolism
MKQRTDRLTTIREIISSKVIGSQDELNEILKIKGYDITQATLSRDLKYLKCYKTPVAGGMYKYALPGMPAHVQISSVFENNAIVSIEFSGHMAVVKTQPGHAGAIAYNIDSSADSNILGTIAGDDTILIILREETDRNIIQHIVNHIF